MKTIGNIRKLFLLLCLIVAGVQSAWAADEVYARIDTYYNIMYLCYDEQRLANMTSDEVSFLVDDGTPEWFINPDVLPTLFHVRKIVFMLEFKNAPITSTHNWFKGMPLLTTIENLQYFPTSVTDMSNMFEGCKALTNLDLSGLNVANVTNMSEMFSGCYGLTSLNLSGWNTAKLVDMTDMFHGCSVLASLNVSGWTNTQFTDMSNIFSGCSALTSIDLTNFNTSAATNMSGMFSGCSKLTSLNLSSFNTSNVTNMSGMFSGCSKLTNLNLSSFNTAKVTNMSGMFGGCVALGSLGLGSFNTSKVTNMSGMFRGCSNLTNITYGSNWNTSIVTDMSGMFENCTNFTSINLSNYNTANVTNMSSMFKGCSNLTGFAYSGTLNTGHVINMSHMFDECSALTTISNLGLSSWNVSNVTDMSGIFRECSSLTSLVLNWYTSNVANMSGMFAGCSRLSSISFGSGWNTSNVTSMGAMFEGCSALGSLNLSLFNTANVADMSAMFRDCSALTTLNLTGFDTSAATGMHSMFRGCSKLSAIDGISSWNTSNVTSMGYMFSGCSALTSLNLGSWNTNSVTDLSGMFSGCNHLATITGLSQWKTPSLGGNVNDNLESMFKDCSALTALDLSGWHTSEVWKMDYMFSGCSNLVTLTLGGWDTSGAGEMEGMFANCSKLTTIYVGSGWTVGRVSSYNTIFANCTSLVGGNGTRWSSSHVDKTYARIDASGTPGYLTEKSDESYVVYTSGNTTLTFYCDAQRSSRTGTSYDLPTGSNSPAWISAVSGTVTNVVFDASFADARPKSTYRWFRDMGSLTAISGIENLNTSQVTTMSEMFYGCSQLGDLDLTSFNTSSVTGMSDMFRNCSALTLLDLTTWNTKKVLNMSNMFRECPMLETIYVGSNWSTQAVTNSSNMFTNCTHLVGGNGTLYDASHVDASYACVDSPASPGYLRDRSLEHNVNLVLVAEACDKGIEVWKDNTQVGSLSKEGGTLWQIINNATNLQLRVPNTYLDEITVNGTDVTTTLPSTTPDDPSYAGYKFYTVTNLSDVMVIEVQYNDNVPVPLVTSSIQFAMYNGSGSLRRSKIWFEDGTYTTDLGGFTTIGFGEKKTISKIEVVMAPDLDNFSYAQQNNTLGTLVDNGDGTYTYTILGEDLTSSIIPLYFPTSDYGPVKTLVRSKNNIKLGYFFGEWINFEGGFVPQYDQTNMSLLNSDVTVMHYGTHNYQYEAGGYSTGIIFIQVAQGTSFRLVEDGVDCTADCVWLNANASFTASPLPFSYRCPVSGYYYVLKNVTTDSYIIVDNGSGSIESPWQVQQQASVVGNGTLSLLNSEGEVVGSVSGDEPVTISWTKGDALILRATAPEGSDLTNAQAHLFLDDGHSLMTKTTDEQGTTYFEYTINEVTLAHSFTLVFSGLETPEIIEFADANVKAICVANWDTDHDGELSKKEAATVTTLLKDGSSVFKNKTALTSFDEFQYFTGLTTVEDGAFLSCGIKSIVLPSTINTIGANAFMTSKLQHIDIPEGVTTIGNYAFYDSRNLETISLPRSLTKIGNSIWGYTAIRHLFIPEMLVTIPIQSTQFIGCYHLSSVIVDTKNTHFNSRDNCSAVLVGNSLYYGCKSTVIPEGVTSIQKNAFRCVGLKKLVIPASVESIGVNAFMENNMEMLVMKRETPIAFNVDRFTPDSIANCVLVVPQGKKTAYADYGWKSIADGGYFKEVVEEEKEIEIVTLPDNIEFADEAVKAICVANWDTDGDGEISKEEAAAVTTLKKNDQSVFYMNKTITHFDEFQYFTGLTEIEASAFYGTSLQSIVLPPNITSIGNVAFNSNQIRSIVIPEGVTSLGNHAFTDCSQLEEVKLPKSLTTIGYDAFANTAIKHIFIPENVNRITPGAGSNIFYNCPNLASVAVDENNPKYDSRDNCMAIIEKPSKFLYGCKNSVIPEGITELWSRAFHAANITSLVIPASVSTIRSGAFLENNLEALEMKRETPIQFSTDMFSSGMTETANCVLIVPQGKKTAYANAGWKSIADGGYFKEVIEADDTDRYDVNRDGTVDISDVTKLVNEVLTR